MLSGRGRRLLRAIGRSKDINGVQLTAGRAILATGTLITLAFNDATVMLHDPGPGTASTDHCTGVANAGLFCQMQNEFDMARFLGVALCLFAISGFLPLLGGLAYWYVASSVFLNLGPVDGGDQISASLAFFSAVISLTDRRLWGWREARRHDQGADLAFVNALWWIIPLQVAFVYVNSGIAKFSSPVWVDGTALFYWVQHPGFNAGPAFQKVALDLLASPVASAAVTWGTIGFELALAGVILLGRRHRGLRLSALGAGVLFHLVIAVMIGLISFFFAMAGALVLSLWRPLDGVARSGWPLSRRSSQSLRRAKAET